MRRALLALVIAAGATAAAACGAKHGDDDDGGGKGKLSTKFHYTQPPAPWAPTKMDGTQVAYYRADYGATITVATECKDVEDVSLPSLVQQELVGIPHRKVVSQTQTLLLIAVDIGIVHCPQPFGLEDVAKGDGGLIHQ